MRYIAHRGNINGKNSKRENSPRYIEEALDDYYDVEIDVWIHKDSIYLGHLPKYKVDIDFLISPGLWCHAKNLEALDLLLEHGIHCFWHDQDDRTLTSQGYIWTYPGKDASSSNSVLVCRDSDVLDKSLISKETYAICGDRYNEFALF